MMNRAGIVTGADGELGKVLGACAGPVTSCIVYDCRAIGAHAVCQYGPFFYDNRAMMLDI